jgi:hypothetical protein
LDITLKSNLDDTIRELFAEIYQDEVKKGSISVDFDDPQFSNNILIQYIIDFDMENENASNHFYKRNILMDRDFVNCEKGNPKSYCRIKSEQSMAK